MPQYELMYLLGSHVADDEVSKISQQIVKFAEDLGAKEIKETQLGKKKLAYPIKKTRNGHYVVVNFEMDGKGINDFDARVRSQENSIIRYIIVNLDEHLERMEKDKAAQAKLVRRAPVAEASAAVAPEPAPKKEKVAAEPIIDLNQEDLDKKIEEALNEDITK